MLKKILVILIIFIRSIDLIASNDSVKVTGVVLDVKTKLPIANAKIMFANEISELLSDDKGEFILNCKKNSKVIVHVRKNRL